MIKCVHRLKPYTKEIGTTMLVPGTATRLRVFPTRLEGEGETIELPVTGPVRHFRATSDLERNELVVEGVGAEGPYKHVLKGTLPAEERSRLFLGCTKAQDWTLMKRRQDLREILPFWHRFGQNAPGLSLPLPAMDKLSAERFLLETFITRFDALGLPCERDAMHHNVSMHEPALPFLKGTSAFIESLFIRREDNKLFLLPTLPPQLHCGRLIGATVGNIKIDLEWSKKTLRRFVLYPQAPGEIELIFPAPVSTYRVNKKNTFYSKNIELSKDLLSIDCIV